MSEQPRNRRASDQRLHRRAVHRIGKLFSAPGEVGRSVWLLVITLLTVFAFWQFSHQYNRTSDRLSAQQHVLAIQQRTLNAQQMLLDAEQTITAQQSYEACHRALINVPIVLKLLRADHLLIQRGFKAPRITAAEIRAYEGGKPLRCIKP